MTYSAAITRTNPSCLLFLIDQSGSMADPFGTNGTTRTKAEGVADAVNRLLQNLVIKCTKGSNPQEGVRNYYHLGVIGYGAEVGPAFNQALSGKILLPISQIADHPVRFDERTKKASDGAGGLVEHSVKFPVWFDAVANGKTPMCQALAQAERILAEWVSQHPTCFPPIVINITDGESTDGDLTGPANTLKSVASRDGGALLFNIHISSNGATPVEFPDTDSTLPDEYSKLLYNSSSPLPDYMRTFAQQEGYSVSPATRGFVFNGDIVSVVKFLDIGTRPANQR